MNEYAKRETIDNSVCAAINIARIARRAERIAALARAAAILFEKMRSEIVEEELGQDCDSACGYKATSGISALLQTIIELAEGVEDETT